MICAPSHCSVKSSGGNTYQPKDEADLRASQYWKPREGRVPSAEASARIGARQPGTAPKNVTAGLGWGASLMGSAYFLRLAGAQPPPKRIVPESWVALSSERITRGAQPPPKRTRRESAIFLDGL